MPPVQLRAPAPLTEPALTHVAATTHAREWTDTHASPEGELHARTDRVHHPDCFQPRHQRHPRQRVELEEGEVGATHAARFDSQPQLTWPGLGNVVLHERRRLSGVSEGDGSGAHASPIPLTGFSVRLRLPGGLFAAKDTMVTSRSSSALSPSSHGHTFRSRSALAISPCVVAPSAISPSNSSSSSMA